MGFYDLDLTMSSRMGEVGEAEERGWDGIARPGGGHIGAYTAHGETRDRRAQKDGTGSVRPGGNAMGEAVSKHKGERTQILFFVTNRRAVESESFREEFVTRFNVDLAVLRQAVRMQALSLNRRGNTRPTAKEAGPLPVSEFNAASAWLEVAPLNT